MVTELEAKMRQAYTDVSAQAERGGLDLRTAAFVLAIKRVARAAASRRTVRQHLPPSLLE